MTTTNYAVAPGAYLEEWIEDQALSQQAVANMLGSSRKLVNEIINGHAPITSDTAVRLERVVGIPADAWLRYEALYRADVARVVDAENLAQHADQISPAAAAYLRKIGVTKATKAKPGQLVADFLAFHRCGTWDVYVAQHEDAHKGEYALAALKEAKAELEQTTLSTWLRAGELTAEYNQGRNFSYSADALTAALPTIRDRVATPDPDMLNDVADLLNQVGVVYFVLEPPAAFPLRAMTRWIDKKVPVVQQTGRWKNDGFFIWALFHELGHVLHDPRGEVHFEYSTEKNRNAAAEKKANTFAMATLLGREGLQALAGVKRDAEIVSRARELGIAPGLAVYLLHRSRQLDFAWGNGLFVDLKGTFRLRD